MQIGIGVRTVVLVLAAGGTMGRGSGRATVEGTQPKVPYTISKETTAITSPLRRAGTVDYVTALNAKYNAGVTPENNGFVLWLQVMGTGDTVLSAKTRAELLHMCGAMETAAGVAVWERYQDYLKRTKSVTVAPIPEELD